MGQSQGLLLLRFSHHPRNPGAGRRDVGRLRIQERLRRLLPPEHAHPGLRLSPAHLQHMAQTGRDPPRPPPRRTQASRTGTSRTRQTVATPLVGVATGKLERNIMQARIITDRQQWNDFVAASPCCNITQSYEWGDLAPHLGAEPLRAGVVDDDGKLLAAMLVLITRAPVLRRNYFYAPRGPVIDDPASPALTVLLNFVKAEARKRGAFMLKVEPSVEDKDPTWLAV